jgi:hypothetical protein
MIKKTDKRLIILRGIMGGIFAYIFLTTLVTNIRLKEDKKNIINGYCTVEQCFNAKGEVITEEEIQKILRPCPTPEKTK